MSDIRFIRTTNPNFVINLEKVAYFEMVSEIKTNQDMHTIYAHCHVISKAVDKNTGEYGDQSTTPFAIFSSPDAGKVQSKWAMLLATIGIKNNDVFGI